MDTQQELQVQQKREVASKQEATIPARVFVPATDIFETDEALTVILEMPGVDKDKVDVGSNAAITATGDRASGAGATIQPADRRGEQPPYREGDGRRWRL